MAERAEAYFADCEAKNICPKCHGPLTSRVGSGARSQGVFCSVKCFGDWHRDELLKRHLERLKDQGDQVDEC